MIRNRPRLFPPWECGGEGDFLTERFSPSGNFKRTSRAGGTGGVKEKGFTAEGRNEKETMDGEPPVNRRNLLHARTKKSGRYYLEKETWLVRKTCQGKNAQLATFEQVTRCLPVKSKYEGKWGRYKDEDGRLPRQVPASKWGTKGENGLV